MADVEEIKCAECTKREKAIWELFLEVDDYKKYISNKSESGGFKTAYIHLDYVFKLVKPKNIDSAIRGGLLSEITIPLYIHLYGTDFLKKRTPRIIKKFKTVYEGKWALGFIEERAKGEPLNKYARFKGNITTREAIDISCQGFRYLRDFQSLQLVHLDIKPSNLIYDKDTSKIYFIDFGFSCTNNCCEHPGSDDFYERCVASSKGTPGFVAPEVFGDKDISVNDMYSYDVYGLAISIMSVMNYGGELKDKLVMVTQEIMIKGTEGISINEFKSVIADAVKKFLDQNDKVKESDLPELLAVLQWIILDKDENYRYPRPDAELVLKGLDKYLCKRLEKKKKRELEKTGFKKEEWVSVEEEVIDPREYSQRRSEDIGGKLPEGPRPNEPSMWNLYGYL